MHRVLPQTQQSWLACSFAHMHLTIFPFARDFELFGLHLFAFSATWSHLHKRQA
jgi:hypothetical protein